MKKFFLGGRSRKGDGGGLKGRFSAVWGMCSEKMRFLSARRDGFVRGRTAFSHEKRASAEGEQAELYMAKLNCTRGFYGISY